MARVVAYIPDLLFGSRVQAGLVADGHAVELVGDVGAVRRALGGADALVVDLTDEVSGRAELVESLSEESLLDGVSTLAFYSHVEADTRQRAEDAGFDLVIPRSRMAREGAVLVTQLVDTGSGD
ncbi:MAG: hypothetical protein WBQ21_01180 [Solirubrobacteraceae bacterium]